MSIVTTCLALIVGGFLLSLLARWICGGLDWTYLLAMAIGLYACQPFCPGDPPFCNLILYPLLILAPAWLMIRRDRRLAKTGKSDKKDP